MIPELGQVALVLALLLSLVQCILPLAGAALGKSRWMAVGLSAAVGQFVFVALAFGALTYAFVTQDFSVAYVAQNSNSALPIHYRYSAVWGAHEGSLLLWALVLASWTLAVAFFSTSLPERFRARVLGVLGFISVGFLLLLVWLSNPFLRHLPALADGNDLNPLLQDIGLIIHPPMLYVGYVGFSVAFAFAVAALIDGRVDQNWVRWSRPWTNVAWAFLTAGIALGSWWAYYELGWGGWWFWDPVENASFMPWLIGTALIHSQAVTEKRGSFRNWTLLLAIIAFSLSLLGTFLVRSGVLVSVHAFAADPERGSYILAFLGVVAGGALALFAARAPRIRAGEPAALLSRETLLLVNNLLLVAACAMVLLGTLAPLYADLFLARKLSVGAEYFGALFPLFSVPLLLLVAFGPLARWGREDARPLAQAMRLPLILAIVAALVTAVWLGGTSLKAILGVMLAAWVAAGTLVWLKRRRERKQPLTGESAGMLLAHLGLAVWVMGAVLVETLNIQTDVRMARDGTHTLAGYEFKLSGLDHYEGPNYIADKGTMEIRREGELIAVLHPEKRQYRAGGQVMTEAGIQPGVFRDLFVSLGEPMDDGAAWAVRLQYKPFIRWVWAGAALMMLGGFMAALDRRFRARRTAQDAVPSRPAAEAA